MFSSIVSDKQSKSNVDYIDNTKATLLIGYTTFAIETIEQAEQQLTDEHGLACSFRHVTIAMTDIV
jgi:hypothetical protein